MRNHFKAKGLVMGLLLLCTYISSVPLIQGESGTVRLGSSVGTTTQPSTTMRIKVPDCVEVGDLLFVDWKFDVGEDESCIWIFSGPYNDHCAIYVGNNTFVDATGQGVSANDYSHIYNWTKNLVFLRVKTATESQRQAAAVWAVSTIGLPYQVYFSFPWFGLKIANTALPFPTAQELYCFELPWAAYYNQGIDIDRNGWRFPWWVTGDDLLHDDDVEVIYKDVVNSTGIITPNKGVYVADRKIMFTIHTTLIFGSIDVEAETYNENVTHVDFYIDDVYKATDSSAPYSWTWDEHVFGKKVIKAVAGDDVGNQYFTAITVWKFF